MKKTLSILLAAIIALSCLSFNLSAFANTRQTAEILNLDEVKSFKMSDTVPNEYGGTSVEHYHYFKFVPPTTGFYKFTLKSSSSSANDIRMCLIDYTVTEISSADFNYVTGECSMIDNEELTANKQYIIGINNDDANETTTDCTIIVNFHTHNMKLNNLSSSTKYSSGYTDYDCDECHYYEFTEIPQISNIACKNTKFTYNSKAQTPTITVVDEQGKELVNGTDYDLSFPTGNIKPGKHTLNLKFKGLYYGNEEFDFVILPKSTTLSKVTKAKKSAKVSWKKNTTVTGYEIQYSTKKNFKGAKKVTVKGSKKTSATIKKLSSNKKYYFRIRTYKTSDYKNYYSAWSKAKSVKIK